MNPTGTTSRIVELTRIITDAVTEIQGVLDRESAPSPSLDENAPPLPLSVGDAQSAVLDATSELQALLTESLNYIHQTARTDRSNCIQVIARYGIASHIPPNGQVSIEDLATRSSLTVQMTSRIIRHATLMHIFREPEPGVVAHTKVSSLLARMDVRDWVRSGTEELGAAGVKLSDALERWPASQEPHETGFALANDSTSSIYEVLAKDSERAKRFANGMTVFSMWPEFDVSFAVDFYDWGSLGEAQVVDVGGSQGAFAMALAKKYPLVHVTVQDMLSVVSSIDASDLATNVSFMAHDLFDTQTVDADVFFFRWIFHNWSDPYCIQILNAQIPAMRYGARLIIQEFLLPEKGDIARWKEMDIRSFDLGMAALFNSRERTIGDWKALFESADRGFVLKKVIQPKGSALGMLEFVWEGKDKLAT